jgi:hypothetical protein
MRNPDKSPRKAYCTGCGVTFEKMHILINHRRTDRCGGRFLPDADRVHLDKLRKIREEYARCLTAAW